MSTIASDRRQLHGVGSTALRLGTSLRTLGAAAFVGYAGLRERPTG